MPESSVDRSSFEHGCGRRCRTATDAPASQEPIRVIQPLDNGVTEPTGSADSVEPTRSAGSADRADPAGSAEPKGSAGSTEPTGSAGSGVSPEPDESADPTVSVDPGPSADPLNSSGPSPFEPERMHAVQWLADYVYGTISTLVAIAGLTFETNPEALTTAGVVVVGAVSIWFAHTLARLVTTRSWQHLKLQRSDIRAQLLGSWSIVAAALPATIIFTLAGIHLWNVDTAFVLAEIVGVLALAVVGIGTVGGRERSMARRIVYVVGLVSVGVMIVLLELVVHLL